MTEQPPNIKKTILEYTIDRWDDEDHPYENHSSMYELAEQTEYSAVRLGSKIAELDGIFEWGGFTPSPVGVSLGEQARHREEAERI